MGTNSNYQTDQTGYQPAQQQAAPSSMTIAGVVGLIAGIVALATSFMPIINNVSFFVALIGAVFAIVGIVSSSKGKRRGKALSIAALIVSALAVVVVLASQSFYSAAIDEAFNSGATDSAPAESTNDASGGSSEATEAQKDDAASAEVPYVVSIDNCELTTDYQGNPAIVVTYTWTNNSENAQAFDVAIDDKAFQNGVQLDFAVVDGMDASASWNEVKPGSTNTVQQAFLLDDQSDVTIECTELFSFDNTIIAEKTFSVA
ncbi:DUF5067 domain-containing protein [Adlercreutzia sp. ZJ138]|uniref:DUF5067 domain-containing protein n=1 Tax=Adlercreutzia sp. ZJ138 TaxID=2709405 RepID=UPI0013EAA4F9|nr:DUF5067 domain-containing protein [Adlercreutzia sp. ZJ138]